MTDTLVRDGANFHATAHVDKYSPDQTRFAERHLLASPFPLYPDGRLDHRLLEHLFPAGPEDGTADAGENLVVNGGLNIITELLIGTALTGSTLSNTYGFVGVGAGTTAAAVTDVALTDDNSANAFYQGFNSSNPSQSAAVITGISTFASGNANFAWQEWCWGTSTHSVGASTGTQLSAFVSSGTQTMWNHKVTSLGTKVSGASWVFTATITQS